MWPPYHQHLNITTDLLIHNSFTSHPVVNETKEALAHIMMTASPDEKMMNYIFTLESGLSHLDVAECCVMSPSAILVTFSFFLTCHHLLLVLTQAHTRTNPTLSSAIVSNTRQKKSTCATKNPSCTLHQNNNSINRLPNPIASANRERQYNPQPNGIRRKE